jgi:hypothetical protein
MRALALFRLLEGWAFVVAECRHVSIMDQNPQPQAQSHGPTDRCSAILFMFRNAVPFAQTVVLCRGAACGVPARFAMIPGWHRSFISIGCSLGVVAE